MLEIDRYTALSNRFKFSWPKIWSISKKDKETRYFENKLRTDWKRLISERMERKIVRNVSKNPLLALKDIVNDFLNSKVEYIVSD